MPPTFVRVEPPELAFDVQEGRVEECRLKLTNVSGDRVGFKLFTDQNDLYVFQPKSGFVERKDSIEVAVKLTRVPENFTAVDHVTVVKARVAKDDETDREKEWRTATTEDEAKTQVVRLKSSFRIPKESNEDVLSLLRRIRKDLQKLQETANATKEELDTIQSIVRAVLGLLAFVLLVVFVGLFDNK